VPDRLAAEAVTPAPPWVLTEPIISVARPEPPPIEVTVRTPAAITVPWPPGRRVKNEPAPPPAAILLRRLPQGPWRWTLPAATAALLAGPLPPRAPRPPA
jgi:hypothetical protein